MNSEKQKNVAATRSAFLANMSHELRTPMNVIIGTGEILMHSGLNENQRSHVAHILKSSKGLLGMINDILDFSKIDSGKFSILEEAYDVSILLEDLTNLAVVRIGEKPVIFELDVREDVPKLLFGDKRRIKQVLINIVGNAVKFTEHGYIRVMVSMLHQAEDHYLKIAVKDTGTGIKKQDLDRLFISFNQVDASQNYAKEGTGLGLTISKFLCEMMHGDITVESTYGQGSMFTVTFKQAYVSDERIVPAPPLDQRILIYEPKKELRDFYEISLKREKLSYALCKSTTELETALPHEFDLILVNQHHLAEIEPLISHYHGRVIPLVEQKREMALTHDAPLTFLYVPMFNIHLSHLLNCDRNKLEQQKAGKEEQKILPLSFVNVLVVDDNELNRDIMKELLALYEMSVDGAISGKEALHMVQEKEYDLIFMDHMMPEMDGIEALHEIRKLKEEKYQNLPVIALTANATDQARAMYQEAGFNGFLSKPVEFSQLQALLDLWLREVNEERMRQHEK